MELLRRRNLFWEQWDKILDSRKMRAWLEINKHKLINSIESLNHVCMFMLNRWRRKINRLQRFKTIEILREILFINKILYFSFCKSFVLLDIWFIIHLDFINIFGIQLIEIFSIILPPLRSTIVLIIIRIHFIRNHSTRS